MNTPDQRQDDFYGASLGLDYQIFEWMTLRMQYDYNQVDSTDKTYEYTENRGLIRVTLAPTRAWRMIR